MDQMEEIQRAQIAAYERRGPLLGRLTLFAQAVGLLAGVIVSFLVFATLASLYPGTGVVKSTPREQPAEATVGDCQRVGPVSGDGLGYWWRCAVTVRTPDGRQVETVVGHSVVTPADRGKPVEFREACYAKGNADCRYGRPVLRIWALALSILGMLRTAVFLLLIVGSGFYLVASVIGVPRYFAWLNSRQARKAVSPAEARLLRLIHDRPRDGGADHVRPDGDEVGEEAGPSLRITFSCPSGPFADVYRSTGPCLSLNGAEVPVPGWGIHRFAAIAGRNAVEIRVSFGGADDFAVAGCDVAVGEGETVDLDYLAPRVLGMKGQIRVLGGPGRTG
ncbi:DUF6346 domain-containing protein [Micromonospora sp. NBC_01412]|uniref:DUF6346 domain-containing protein n=1 Tax=Micromonospora sp. NBC_01412 TaxID=2903590 RepID=UPI003247DB55